jgi:hypothetical protein
MNTFSVVENLDIFEHILFDFLYRTIIPPMNTFLFRRCEKALDTGIVKRASGFAHIGSDFVLLKDFSKPETAVLRSPVAAENKLSVRFSSSQCITQRPFHKLRINFFY